MSAIVLSGSVCPLAELFKTSIQHLLEKRLKVRAGRRGQGERGKEGDGRRAE